MTDIRVRAARVFAGLTFRLVLLGLVALLALNTYADFALKGPLGIGFHFEGWKPKAQRYKREFAAVLAAQEAAGRAQQAVNDAAERRYRTLAERIDDEADHARPGALADAERFIAANRVRPVDRGAPCGPVAAAPDRGAGDGEGPGRTTELDAGLVAVPEGDVRICTVNTLQAETARAWALDLERASVPD